MRLWRTIAELTTVVSLMAPNCLAQVQDDWNFPDFSGRQIQKSGAQETSLKTYYSNSRVRVDTTAAIATLYVPKSNSVYRLSVYPDGKRGCVVMRYDQAKMLPIPLELLFGTKLKRIPAGTEVVEGHTCDVEDVEVTTPDGKVIRSRVWEAKELKGVPVKIESQLPEGKLTVFYRDIVLDAPDAALLTPPDNCTPVDKMGQVVENVESH